MQDQCRHNEQCWLSGLAGKGSKNVYYMVHGCHCDGDLVHSEFTDLGMSIYTTPGKIPPKRIPYDHKFQCS